MHSPTFSALRAPLRAVPRFSRIRSGMEIKPVKRVAIAFIAALAISPVSAQRAPVVVDGALWLSSTPEVRKAFLVGAGNMIALEAAYAKKKGTPPPVAGTMAGNALHALTLDQVSTRVTRWYEANPGRRNLPVMGVIWIDIVAPGASGKWPRKHTQKEHSWNAHLPLSSSYSAPAH